MPHTRLFGDSARETWQPKQIGPYRLDRVLGRGGMGVVYLAWRNDEQFRKQVAIKILPGIVQHEQSLQRFLIERQILANLEHPNIARLIDGGSTERGEPYLVMEYVRGAMPLDRYCDDRGFGLMERLRLFRKVCAAVSYAHQQLVVHRDLKPSNILVTDEGDVKLVDFGIAKLLYPLVGFETQLTRTGVQAMTPEYASPEQLRGDPIGTASDVYTLGVVLYQLLTGQLPHRMRDGAMADLIREVCDGDAPKPSTRVLALERTEGATAEIPGIAQIEGVLKLGRRLSGDLDNIILRALRKEPEERYTSADQFGEDIQRYLDGLPVLARPATTFYRASKFAARNPGAIAAAAAVLVAVTAGVVSTARQAARAEVQRAIAEAQAREAQRQKSRAEQLAEEAQRSRKLAEAKAEEAERQRVLAASQFKNMRELAGKFLFDLDSEVKFLPGSTPIRKKIVEEAQKYLSVVARDSSDPEAALEVGTAYHLVGRIQRARSLPNLGDSTGALDSFKKALAIADRVAAANGESPRTLDVRFNAYLGIGDVMAIEGDGRGALPYFERALDMARRMAEASPRDYQKRRGVLRALNKVADAWMDVEEHDKARPYFERAVEMTARNLVLFPKEEGAYRDRAVSLNQLGAYYLRRQMWKESLEQYLESEKAATALLERRPTNAQYRRDRMVAQALIGVSYIELGKPELALPYHEKEIDTARSLLAADPRNLIAIYDSCSAHVHVGRALRDLKRLPEAVEILRKGVELADQALEIDPRSTQALGHQLLSRSNLADALADQNNWDEAARQFEKVVAIAENVAAEQPDAETTQRTIAKIYRDYSDFHLDAARSHNRDEHLAKARTGLEKAIAIYARLKAGAEQKELAAQLTALGKR